MLQNLNIEQELLQFNLESKPQGKDKENPNLKGYGDTSTNEANMHGRKSFCKLLIQFMLKTQINQ